MKYVDIVKLTDEELTNKVLEMRREKLNLKIQSRTGQLEKTARVKDLRRDIARCLTEETARKNKEVKA